MLKVFFKLLIVNIIFFEIYVKLVDILYLNFVLKKN